MDQSPGYVTAAYNLASLLAQQQKTEQALQVYLSVLHFEPAQTHYNIASMYSRSTEKSDITLPLTLEHANKSLVYDPHKAAAYAIKASYYYQLYVQASTKELEMAHVANMVVQLNLGLRYEHYYENTLRLVRLKADSLKDLPTRYDAKGDEFAHVQFTDTYTNMQIKQHLFDMLMVKSVPQSRYGFVTCKNWFDIFFL